jgi:hypothetical protein
MRPSAMRPSMSSSLLRATACVLALSIGLTDQVGAQSRVRVPSAVLSTPNGRAIGSVHPGTELRVIETKGAYAKVAVGGFVERTRLSAQRGSASPRVGSRSAVLRAKGASSGKSIASLDPGTIVTVGTGAAAKGWVRVTREGWVLKSALAAPAVATTRKPTTKTVAKAPAPARRSSAGEVETPATRSTPRRVTTTPAVTKPAETPAAASSSASPARASTVNDSTLSPTSNVALRTAPDARPLATVVPGAALTPLARERGWVRVRLEGWVQERDLTLADSSIRSAVSAADLRADPQGSRGKMVRWTVQILATQKADALRRDLNPDETYLLARGPNEENALLYLVVPPALLPIAKTIPELSQALVTARVRTGRSDLVGVPILDLLTLVPKK